MATDKTRSHAMPGTQPTAPSPENEIPVDVEDLEDGCCMHGDCAMHCPDDICHGNQCGICPESQDDEEYEDDA